LPKRFCACPGCLACASPDRRPGNHNALFDLDTTRTLKCPPCQDQARIKKNTDPAGRPSAAARGYGAEWRRVSAEVIAEAVTCYWCNGAFAADDPATADHLVPKARGGTNDKSNLVAAHRSCNSRRGGQMRRSQP
jgi:5-methylcytosine-specific restriction endonuclease McrA